MAQGGHRQPKPGQAPSGPGRYSTREDGNRVPRGAPDMDRPDRQYGDRKNAEQAMQVAPIPKQSSPKMSPRGQGGGGGAPLPARGSDPMPNFLFEGSSRPGEPVTSGLPMGPGAGPDALQTPAQQDVRLAVLEHLYRNFDNQDALRMRNEIITGQKQEQVGPMMPQAPVDTDPMLRPDEDEVVPQELYVAGEEDTEDEFDDYLPDEEIDTEPTEMEPGEAPLDEGGGMSPPGDEAPPPAAEGEAAPAPAGEGGEGA